MSSSFEKSHSSGSKSSPLKKIFRTAVLGIILASGWADYQYYAPATTKDAVGAWVEQKTGSELLGEVFGHKATAATQPGQNNAGTVEVGPKAPTPPAP